VALNITLQSFMQIIKSPARSLLLLSALLFLAYSNGASPVSVTVLIVGGALAAYELFSYLQGERLPLSAYTLSLNKIEKVEEKVVLLQEQLFNSHQAMIDNVFSESEKEDLKRNIIERLPNIAIEEAFFELSQGRAADQRLATLSDLRRLYDGVIGSLDRQIADLGRRANLNLVMGTGITIVGLVILSYFVFYTIHPVTNNVAETIVYFGTRVTLVVFIEVFAYFFLRLYRYSLFEIKYFQNEITNARFKIISIEVCSREGTKTTLDKICLELTKTERNFVLKKGETTISLRRDELEQLNDSSVADLIQHLLASRASVEKDSK
jgi:hypothetical protein